MSDEQQHDADEQDSLVSRLNVIEDQPLDTRAAALAQLHDELKAQLEAGDSARGSEGRA